MKYAEKAPAVACIQLSLGVAYCSREFDPKWEYAFMDRKHAVNNYADGVHLRACPDCVAVVRKDADSQSTSSPRDNSKF
jgi:hypothetical protein